jgi:Xaa-Pro dipeptidase
MRTHRRTFLKRSAAAGAGLTAALTADAVAAQGGTERPGGQSGSSLASADLPTPIRSLRPMTGGILPISTRDRQTRIEKARRLMAENHTDAIILEGGSSLFYFTGVRWGLSERPFVAVIPAKGELAWVSPGFEEARARELIELGGRDLRTWQEDESPYRLVAQILKDRGVTTGRVGVEERLRFFVFNGIKKEAPALDYASADPITAGCRMIKSPAEIALM